MPSSDSDTPSQPSASSSSAASPTGRPSNAAEGARQEGTAPRKQSKYAFVVAACCFLMMFVDVGLVATSFNVYQPYIVRLPGVGDAGGSVVIAFRMLVSAVAIVFIVGYYHLVDMRVGISLSMFSSALGFFLFGMAQGMAGLLLASVFTGIGYGLGGVVAMTYAMNRWFANDVASVVGVAATGSGLAAMVMPPILTRIAQDVSLSWAFWCEAAVAAAMATAAFLLVRNRPSDMGLDPYHIVDKRERQRREGKAATQRPKAALPKGVRLSRHAHMALAFCSFCVGTICISAYSFIAIHMTNNGFSPAFVAALLSLGGVCITVSKVVSGRMFDALGVRKGTQVLYLFLIMGVVCALLVPTGSPVVAALCIVGLYYGGALNSVGLPVWGLSLAHPDDRPKLIKNIQVFYSVGGLTFNFVPGFLVGVFGSYEVSYVLFLAMAVASLAVVSVIYRRYLRVPAAKRATATA